MYSSKEAIHERMWRVHDEIKNHPFRVTFSTKDIHEYKHLLYELSEVWCDLIYRCSDHTESEKKLYRQFGFWIHDYRQELRTYHKDTFPMEFFPYYEQMLQVTHRYLETGYMDVFYSPDVVWDNEEKRYTKVSRYELITTEKCGIVSPELPRYFPVTYRLCIDDEEMKKYFLEKWSHTPVTDEERIGWFEDWRKNLKPVLVWIHENRNDSEEVLKYAYWRSA